MLTFSEFLKAYRPNEIARPFIIAEAGVNHEGSLELAKRLIDEAAEAGAQAIKFQTYKADSLASKNSPYYWDIGKESSLSQYELFKKYDSFWKKEYEALKIQCDKAGIEFMSTAFDSESALFLNDLMNVFKISSSDLTNLPFIELQCSFGKPIILSTGASYLWEIQQAVDVIEGNGNSLCLMHCVLNYPTRNSSAHLGMIKDLIRRFPMVLPGYSDHTLPQNMDVVYASVLLGAAVVEKHFTYDKTLPGNDHYHAMDKEDLKLFWEKWDRAEEFIGSFTITSLPEEEPARKNARRSLVAAKKIEEGHIIKEEHLTWKRPASGISPQYMYELLGKKALRTIAENEILTWNMFS